MNKIFIVQEYYNNGEFYEDEYEYQTSVYAFSTREMAEEYIKAMPETIKYDHDEFVEVKKDGSFFRHVRAYGKQYTRHYIHHEYRDVYATLAYYIDEIPFEEE